MSKKKSRANEPELIQAEPKPFAPTPSNRVRASSLRARLKAGGFLTPEDAAWLSDYEEARARDRDLRNGVVGASRSHKVEYSEETAESVGTGAAAEVAAAAAMSREEGRRYDSLLSVGITALRTAVDTYSKMCNHMLERNRELERSHVQMMDAIREHTIARIDAEAEVAQLAKEAEAGGSDGIGKLAEQLLPYLLPSLDPLAGGKPEKS